MFDRDAATQRAACLHGFEFLAVEDTTTAVAFVRAVTAAAVK